MTAPTVTVTATEYAVSILPEGHIDRYHFELIVAWRSEGRWAVTDRFGNCLGTDGAWDFEMRPSAREDEWLATHRFDLETALELARKEAPKMRVNGASALQVWRRMQDKAVSS